MQQSFVAVSAAVVLALSATACSSAAGQATPPDPPKKVATEESMLASVTESVLADASSQTGIAKSSITVGSTEAVVWADGSLGCPAPGLMYTMAQVPGYRIRVQAGEQQLDYHADRRGHFVLCPSGRATDPVGPVAY